MKDRRQPVKKEQATGQLKSKASGSSKKSATGKHGAGNKKNADVESDDESESESESEKENENDVSRALFFYADDLITECLTTRGKEMELQQAKKALEKCKFLILHENVLLQKILKRASSRDMSDNKVPPGSSSVQRLLSDDRYLLSLVCINESKLVGIIDGNILLGIQYLKEALLFFPKSSEANEYLSQYFLYN